MFLYFTGNATVCRQVTNPGSLRDVEWATQSCLLSFNTIGIWPETMDGTDLSTCAKSNGSKLMATGDDFGKIKVYSFPVTQPKVISRKKEQIMYNAHRNSWGILNDILTHNSGLSNDI